MTKPLTPFLVALAVAGVAGIVLIVATTLILPTWIGFTTAFTLMGTHIWAAQADRVHIRQVRQGLAEIAEMRQAWEQLQRDSHTPLEEEEIHG